MKERLSISEMAQLRGISAETLRHYDRIDLFKPQHVDPHTGYRYYSIFQYEVLGTIKELRQLGMNTNEVKQYFNERNIKNSTDILAAKHEELVRKLKEMTALEENIRDKLAFLREVIAEVGSPAVTIRQLGRRKLFTLHQKINSNLELCYGVLGLENRLTETAPILASNRLGVLLSQEDLEARRFESPSTIFVVAKRATSLPKVNLVTIPAGSFACIRYYGELWNRSESLDTLCRKLVEDGYVITGDALQIMQVDITITDNPNEVMFEIQVPIRKQTANSSYHGV
ncbi:MerR family transcriptional regulator [Paenibacillus lignilyticus]|uniref:MerR family transcriptional regulator n=1 Tax=Paenibacillus lignilyticus TaxID=1172615 RepID=A0ABS5C5R3_9BACL|nr:MerR family transcriptional regulator [Paenibacillus lignilyticus]MBP3961185.1 MerR family transcriptional regulator [Paenibacillus lignilyticus]